MYVCMYVCMCVFWLQQYHMTWITVYTGWLHSFIDSLIHSLLSLIDSLTHWLARSFALSPHSLTHSFIDSLTHWISHSLIDSLTSLIGSLTSLIDSLTALAHLILHFAFLAIPCDVVVLKSSSPNSSCFIQTTNLDGETNLKPRIVCTLSLLYAVKPNWIYLQLAIILHLSTNR